MPMTRPVKISSLARETPTSGASRAGPTGTPRREPAQASFRLSPPTRRSLPATSSAPAPTQFPTQTRHDRRRERVERGVEPRERLHPRDAAGCVEPLADVGAGAERTGARRGEHEHAQCRIGPELVERGVQVGDRGGVERVADVRAVETHDLDPVAVPHALEGWHAARFYTIVRVMTRLFAVLPVTLVFLLLLAPAALADNGTQEPLSGEGLYGKADDKVVTNFFFAVIAFFPLFILAMSLLQWRLDKRKERRKAAAKSLHQKAGGRWQTGW